MDYGKIGIGEVVTRRDGNSAKWEMVEAANAAYMGSERDIEDLKEAVGKGGLDAYVECLQNKQDEWRTIPLNIAVIGSSGAGKSSFINAIRNVTAEDPGAAEVDCNETTSDIKPYPHPNNEMLKLWDMPGVGTPNFPKETYLEKIQVEHYDFFLLLSEKRFTEIDLWLGSEIKKRHKQLHYVRTHIHSDVRNDRKDHPTQHNKEVVLAKIRARTEKELAAIGEEHINVFLIDNHKQQKYDFCQLQQNLVNNFPDMKRQALIFSLSAFSDKLIKTKANELRKGIWSLAALSAVVACIPIPGVSLSIDIAATLIKAKFYHKQLGLDEISIQRHAQLTSCDPQELQRVVNDALGDDFFSIQGIKSIMSGTAGVGIIAATISEEFTRVIPVVGGVVAGAMSFGGTYLVHGIMIDKLEAVALEVFRYAVQHSVQTNDDDE